MTKHILFLQTISKRPNSADLAIGQPSCECDLMFGFDIPMGIKKFFF